MSYTADQDLLSVMGTRTLVELSAEDPLADEPDWAVVAQARGFADAQVDARLRQRYVLPLGQAPRELQDWALALARLWLYQRRPDGGDLPKAVTDAARDALAALDAIRDGKMTLDVPATPAGGADLRAGAGAQAQSPEPTFSAETLGGY